MASELHDPDELAERLRTARVIAVLGAREDPSQPGFYVPDYLYRQGYRVLPVNPGRVGTTLWGVPVRASLAELPERVDIVDVFRRADALAAHLTDLFGMYPPPGLVWLQSGIFDARFTARVVAEGIDVVQDRCTYADHRAWGIGPVPRAS